MDIPEPYVTTTRTGSATAVFSTTTPFPPRALEAPEQLRCCPVQLYDDLHVRHAGCSRHVDRSTWTWWHRHCNHLTSTKAHYHDHNDCRYTCLYFNNYSASETGAATIVISEPACTRAPARHTRICGKGLSALGSSHRIAQMHLHENGQFLSCRWIA